MAMKAASLFVAGLAVAISSIAPANADKNENNKIIYGCSVTTWPSISALQCSKPKATSYVECTKMVTQNGWRGSDAWWICSNQAFKN
jgi:hypothetical protein